MPEKVITREEADAFCMFEDSLYVANMPGPTVQEPPYTPVWNETTGELLTQTIQGFVLMSPVGLLTNSDAERVLEPSRALREHEQTARAIYYCVSGYRVSIGETPYAKWEEQSEVYQSFVEGAVPLVRDNPFITARQIHDYWMAWAREHKSDHSSIIPFDELSPSERIKDELVIQTVRACLQYGPPPPPPETETDVPPLMAAMDKSFGDMRNGWQPHQQYERLRKHGIELERKLAHRTRELEATRLCFADASHSSSATVVHVEILQERIAEYQRAAQSLQRDREHELRVTTQELQIARDERDEARELAKRLREQHKSTIEAYQRGQIAVQAERDQALATVEAYASGLLEVGKALGMKAMSVQIPRFMHDEIVALRAQRDERESLYQFGYSVVQFIKQRSHEVKEGETMLDTLRRWSLEYHQLKEDNSALRAEAKDGFAFYDSYKEMGESLRAMTAERNKLKGYYEEIVRHLGDDRALERIKKLEYGIRDALIAYEAYPTMHCYPVPDTQGYNILGMEQAWAANTADELIKYWGRDRRYNVIFHHSKADAIKAMQESESTKLLTQLRDNPQFHE